MGINSIAPSLFVLSGINDIVVQTLANHPNRVIIVTNQETMSALNGIGVHSTLLQGMFDSEDEQNAHAFVHMMPGVLRDLTLNDSMPLWHALTIDRLRFWTETPELLAVIKHLEFSELFISMDITISLPWAVALWAREMGKKVTGLQFHSVRIPEMVDFFPIAPLTDCIVTYSDDLFFLLSFERRDVNISHMHLDRPKPPQIEDEDREKIKKAMGLSTDPVSGIIYDRRDEWAFDRLVHTVQETRANINAIIIPYDKRSATLYHTSPFRRSLNWTVFDDLSSLKACREIVMFRFDERIYYTAQLPVAIYDWHNLNKSKELCHNLKRAILYTSFSPEGSTT